MLFTAEKCHIYIYRLTALSMSQCNLFACFRCGHK